LGNAEQVPRGAGIPASGGLRRCKASPGRLARLRFGASQPIPMPGARIHGDFFSVALAADQRLAMYIVISKPKRRSVKAGVVHCIIRLQKVGWHEN
jgi:hypothetical protein